MKLSIYGGIALVSLTILISIYLWEEESSKEPILENAILHTRQVGLSQPRLTSPPKLIEHDLADLEHQIERGDYIEKINSPETPPEIKAELRALIRLHAQLSIKLARRHLEEASK